jgi:hypothetical protein
VTKADTGLPGRPSQYAFPIRPNDTGLPGLIATPLNKTSPLSLGPMALQWLTPDRQTAEIHIRVALMNRFNALGTAEIIRVA